MERTQQKRVWVAVLTESKVGESEQFTNKKFKVFDTLEKAKEQKNKWIDENKEWINCTKKQDFAELEEDEFSFYLLDAVDDNEFLIDIFASDIE